MMHGWKGPDDPFDGTEFESKATDQSDLDTNRVDVDPALFGDLDDGPIEQVTADPHEGIGVSAQQIHEWQREALIAEELGFCPACDGEIERAVLDDGTAQLACHDCGRVWVRDEDGTVATD